MKHTQISQIMDNCKKLEALLKKHGYTDFKWINPKDIVVSQWVRMKCMFGCANYGRNASCPPNVPSVSECRQFFDEYSTAVVLHFEKTVAKPEDRHAWSKGVNQGLLKLEREFFISGYEKALLIDFNYEYEPLPGKFPFPGLGPFSLLDESYFNYYGKMMFKWVYWNMMLKGLELPLENQMIMAGKMRPSI